MQISHTKIYNLKPIQLINNMSTSSFRDGHEVSVGR